jgi:hypothetical protein
LAPSDITWQGPVPLTSPLRTLLDCIASDIQPDMLQAAITQALDRGLVDRRDIAANTPQVGTR